MSDVPLILKPKPKFYLPPQFKDGSEPFAILATDLPDPRTGQLTYNVLQLFAWRDLPDLEANVGDALLPEPWDVIDGPPRLWAMVCRFLKDDYEPDFPLWFRDPHFGLKYGLTQRALAHVIQVGTAMTNGQRVVRSSQLQLEYIG